MGFIKIHAFFSRQNFIILSRRENTCCFRNRRVINARAEKKEKREVARRANKNDRLT